MKQSPSMKLSELHLYYPHDVRAAFQLYAFLSGSSHDSPSIQVRNEREIVSLAIAGKVDVAFLSLVAYQQLPNVYDILPVGAVFSPLSQMVEIEGSSSESVLAVARQVLKRKNCLSGNETIGADWRRTFNLPLPEAVFCVSQRLSEETRLALASAMRDSIMLAKKFKQRALQYAVNFSTAYEHKVAEQFCAQHFNALTDNLGEDGSKSIQLFMSEYEGSGD